MKNNKGFAITATIYGFLILFLIILLSVLSVMRSQNNRSITISEKIENKLFPINEVVIGTPQENDFSMITKRGKYYANVFCGTSTTPNEYFFYAGNNFDGNNIVLYKNNGQKVTSTDCNAITSIIVTKYYTNDSVNNIKQDMREGQNYWKYINPAGTFNVTYNSNTNMNKIEFVGGGNWESIYYPISLEKDKKYTISFKYKINAQYQMLDSNEGGIAYQILTNKPYDSNNSSSLVYQSKSGHLPNTTTTENTVNIEFTAENDGTYYLNFNFGYVADGREATNIDIGKFSITEG